MSQKIREEEIQDIDENPEISESQPKTWKKALVAVLIAFVIILLIGLIVLGVLYLSKATTPTSKIRDIFIIFMALEALVIGVALIILIIQVASLLNLINNEVRPIIADAQETISTIKGTSKFLSDELVGPAIKVNSFLAGFKKIFSLFRILKK
jgi:hypothetical protein